MSNSNTKHVYRFALYGTKSSGKTCILSALSLPREAHPEGFSCSWIKNVADLQSLELSKRPEVKEGYIAGRDWLLEQRERLQKGEIPRPNPNNEPYFFRFDFGSKEGGMRQIEIADYSGELIEDTADVFVKKLRNHIQECDGLLILAEVPHSGDLGYDVNNTNDNTTGAKRSGSAAEFRIEEHKTELSEGLNKLTSAFLVLSKEKDDLPLQEWPVALLFNKFDRIPGASKERENLVEKIDEFLAQSPAPPHASLRDTILNTVGKSNIRCFPVSAFGEHAFNQEGLELPQLKNGQLQSFGLEDPFIWAMDQHDSVLIEQLEEGERQVSWWAFPQLFFGSKLSSNTQKHSWWRRLFGGVSPLSGLKEVRALQGRIPKKESELFRRASAAWQKLVLKFVSQCVALAVSLCGVFSLGEFLIDGFRYRGVIAAQNNPAATIKELESAEAWLDDYYKSLPLRHGLSKTFLVSRSEAFEQLLGFQSRREESYWEPVSQAEMPARLELARTYLNNFPNGKYRSEADLIVANAKSEEDEIKNREHLEQIATELKTIDDSAAGALDRLLSLSQKIDAIPYPDARSTGNSQRQTELRSEIAEKQTQITKYKQIKDWEEFEQTYFSLMRSNNVSEAAKILVGPEAAKILVGRQSEDEKLEKLKNDFANRAFSIVQGSVRDAINFRSWKKAREIIKSGSDANVIQLLSSDSFKQIQRLASEVNEAEDRDLYEQIVKNKPTCNDQIEAYLTRAPLKTMQSEVAMYQQYLKKIQNPIDLTIGLSSVQWDTKYWSSLFGYKNDITVFCKGQPLIVVSGIQSEPGSQTGSLGAKTIKAKLTETITIDVNIVARYGYLWTSETPGGSGKWTGTVNQLRSGVTIDLPGKEFVNRAIFYVSGLPSEPDLPEWKQP